MLQAAKDLHTKYAYRMRLNIAEGVPFEEYQQMMEGSDAILDQLYAYTPSMNPLLAMSKGIICIGGGEPENYEILGEDELRPIINLQPTYESVYQELEQLILHPERIPMLKQQSREYVKRHHDYLKVARQYEQLYLSLLSPSSGSQQHR
jgi:glycosyltransferase involved in cell wall biosynthesis